MNFLLCVHVLRWGAACTHWNFVTVIIAHETGGGGSPVSTEEYCEHYLSQRLAGKSVWWSAGSSCLPVERAAIVGAQLVRSIRLLTYVPTREVLQSLGARLTSGELAAIFQQLFCCLSGVDDLAVDLSVKVEDLQECKDQLGFIGMAAVLYMVPLKVYGCNVVVFRIFSLFFENFCLLKLGLVVVSHCYKLHEIQQILNFLWLMFSFLVVIVNV